ncbi:XK-related protein 9 [Myripristis murdjan]|uniref:XK-related protein n=1 Tax=Myripristis murdjan TaxID=586833 RepID=A0A667YW39_9TELE|nr:XK-related protein 9 [Myripristis murdjan]
MLQSDFGYTKLRWLLTILGLLLYVVDIGTDVGLALQYLLDKQFVWAGLTLVFVLAGLVTTQIFSYAWYWDDMNNVLVNPEGNPTVLGISKCGLAAVHLFGMGIFSRYYHLLKKGYHVIWPAKSSYTVEQTRDAHQNLFVLATDLSMLKLFETFMEGVPQLLLQLYIILGHDNSSILQCVCMAFSFFNIAWSLVDFRRCLRRSLPSLREMPSGLPTAVYLLYKLFTITPHILSYTLLLVLSTYTSVALAFLWLLGTTWAHLIQTNFCSCRGLEWLYRAVIGVILTFTFFNIKGQDTKVVMSIYYFFYSLINFMAPILLALLKPETQTTTYLLPVAFVIFAGTVLGLVFLMVYYICLHPRGKWREADEVDGLEKEPETMLRIKSFLQP